MPHDSRVVVQNEEEGQPLITMHAGSCGFVGSSDCAVAAYAALGPLRNVTCTWDNVLRSRLNCTTSRSTARILFAAEELWNAS